MQPLRDNVIVKRIAAERKTESGLILQSNAGEPDRAEIVTLGPKVDEVSVGDVVLLNWNKAVKIDDEQYVVPVTEIIFIYGE